MGLGLIQKRYLPWPTARGWLVLASAFCGLAALVVFGLYPWLSLDAPGNGNMLVLEGWVPDHVAARAVEEFRKRADARICVTGGPVTRKHQALAGRTYAEVASKMLQDLGIPSDRIIEAPAPPTPRGRTLIQAVAAKRALAGQSVSAKGLVIITEGPHGRRSRAVYQRVFGPKSTVGVISVPPVDYDPRDWWRSSQGTKDVLGEAVAQLHQALFGLGDTPEDLGP